MGEDDAEEEDGLSGHGGGWVDVCLGGELARTLDKGTKEEDVPPTGAADEQGGVDAVAAFFCLICMGGRVGGWVGCWVEEEEGV